MTHPDADSAYIITGTTRGIGRALAQAVLARGKQLFAISRTPRMQQDSRRHDYACDLGDPDQIRNTMTAVMTAIGRMACADVILINNAGVLTPIGPIEKATDDQIRQHLAVNLQAPALLTAQFIRLGDHVPGRRRIINITSGAGEHPYAGWALYCASKAAVNMLTASVALEQRERERPVGVCAVAPGVVDTDMQHVIRCTSGADFPEREHFARLHAEGRLAPPEQVADLILELDIRGLLASGGLYDLRDARRREDGWDIRPRNLA